MFQLLMLPALLALSTLINAVPFSSTIHKKTALIIIDVQNDFITGSLNNSRAPSILPKIYQLLDNHTWPFIAASQDWHPVDHVSFAAAHPGYTGGDTIQIPFVDTPSGTKLEWQGLYANHCVPETWGAQIETGVQTRLHFLEGYTTPVHYVKKAQNHSVDSYSAFADNQYHRFTTLQSELNLHGIEKVVITGLITNACVRGTAIDATKLGFEAFLIEDATESTSDAAKETAIEELVNVWGVTVLTLADWEAQNPITPVKRSW